MMTTTGTKLGDAKFAELQKVRWEEISNERCHCKEHDAFFNPLDEPCWGCYTECIEKDAKHDNTKCFGKEAMK